MVRRSVHIIGGAGGIGRWLLDKALGNHESLYCYDVNERALEGLPKTINSCPLSSVLSYETYANNFQPNDWILLAVPLTAFETTLQQIAGVLKEGSLVVSLTSVQEKAFGLLEKYVPKTCVYLGCHPLFGHTISSPVGQIVALIGYNENFLQHREFWESLSAIGLMPTDLSPAVHDRYMAVVQALTHFCLLSFAGTISKNQFRPSSLLRLRTPNFQFLYAFASRVIKQSPTTTGSIQSTEEAAIIREAFLQTARSLHEEFQKAKSVEECARIIEDLRAPLTGAEVGEGVEVAAVAVESLQRFEELLHRYKRSGAPFVFRHRVTEKLHVVRIVKINHDDVVFEESTKEDTGDSGNQVAIGLNEIARINYKGLGINLRTPRRNTVKKRTIKLLSAEELKDFYKSRIHPIALVHNFRNPYEQKEEYFEELLPRLIKGLWQCEFLDAYRRRNGSEVVTLKLAFNPNCEKGDIVERVRRLVEEGALRVATNKASQANRLTATAELEL